MKRLGWVIVALSTTLAGTAASSWEAAAEENNVRSVARQAAACWRHLAVAGVTAEIPAASAVATFHRFPLQLLHGSEAAHVRYNRFAPYAVPPARPRAAQQQHRSPPAPRLLVPPVSAPTSVM